MTSAAERMRRHRKRAEDGRACLLIEIDFDNLPDVLVAGGHLDPNYRDDRKAVKKAIERMLKHLAAVEISRDA